MLLKFNGTNWLAHTHAHTLTFLESVLKSFSPVGYLYFKGYLHFITKRVMHCKLYDWRKSFEFIANEKSVQVEGKCMAIELKKYRYLSIASSNTLNFAKFLRFSRLF